MTIGIDKLTTPNVKAVNFTSDNKPQEGVPQNNASKDDSSKLYMSLACLAAGLGTITTIVGYRKGVAKGKTLGQVKGL